MISWAESERMRDPRIDPEPGDVVFRQAKNRLIERFVCEPGRGMFCAPSPHTVHYREHVVGRIFYCSIKAWRRWCKQATVAVKV